MGGKKGFSAPKIKISAPKITVGKDLGMKNIGKVASNVVKATGKAGEDVGRGVAKGATTAAKTLGDTGSQLVSSVGKGVEGIAANQNDALAAMLKGDFKGMAGESLASLQSAKDMAKGLAKAQGTLSTGALKSVGDTIGSKEISQTAENIKREGAKGVDTYGDAAIDVGANVATGGTYGLAKQAAQGLSTGGLGGMLSGKGLQDMAVGAIGSYAGVDPNMLKMGLSAAQGDLKGAALQGLGSFGGIDPNMLKMGASALSGDKGGLASGLASQFGAGDTASSMLGAVAGGKKNDMLSALGGQLGLDPKMASMLGAVAGGDLKGAALSQLAGATGIPDNILKQVSTGKFDVGELAKNANLTASLGDTAKAYLPGSVSSMIDKAQGAGRVVQSADAYANDIQNQALDRAGLGRDQVKAIQDVQGAAQSAYQIASGDTLAAIAKKQGTTVEALMAANPNIKDPNKIAAGMKLNLPGAIPAGIQPETPEQTAARRAEADRKVLEAAGSVPKEPGLWDKTKDFFGGVGDKIGGAVDTAGNFVKDNQMLATGAIQAGAATAGYMAGDKARDEQEKLLEQQILDTKGVTALQDYKLSKERELAYSDQQKFLEGRIAGGGMTAKEREMQQQGQDRAARAAAAGRLAGVEQQARMGQGATGAGAGLAASLMGAQSQANAAADSERAAATSAAQNLEQAYATRPAALEAKAKSEMDLARLQDEMGIRKVSQIGEVRTAQGTLAAQAGDAQGRLAAGLADIATRGVLGQQIGPSDATAKEREIAAQAQAEKDKAALATKATAAGNVSGTAPTQGNADNAGRAPATTQAPQTQADKFNQAGQAPKPQPAPQPGQGQGYGVLAPVENLIKNPSQAVKNPAQAIQTVQQIAKNPQAAIEEAKKKAQEAATAAAKKAAGSIVPDSLKNIFKF